MLVVSLCAADVVSTVDAVSVVTGAGVTVVTLSVVTAVESVVVVEVSVFLLQLMTKNPSRANDKINFIILNFKWCVVQKYKICKLNTYDLNHIIIDMKIILQIFSFRQHKE